MEQAGDQLLGARAHSCLELAVVSLADLKEVARIERTSAGSQATPPSALRALKDRPDRNLTKDLFPPAVAYSEVSAGSAGGRIVEQTLATAVMGADGGPIGWVFLRLDFGAVARRLNRSPRLLGFLVNRDGTYLADPDPSRVLSRRGNAPLDRAFEQLLAQPIDSGRPAEVKLLENLTLPSLTVYAASAQFTTAPEPGRLRQARNNLVTKFPDLRMGRVDDAPDRIVFRAADQETIRLARA